MAYSKIVKVILADSAPAGVTVYVGGYIRNIDPYWSISVNEWGYYNSSELEFDGWWTCSPWLDPGAEWPFGDTFIMPDHDVVVKLESWVWWDEPYNAWYLDATYSKMVRVEAVVPPPPPPPPPPPEEYYTLDVLVVPAGAGYVILIPFGVEYVAGTRVTVQAVAYSGYEFVRWSGDASGTELAVNVIMDRDKEVLASFETVPVPPPPPPPPPPPVKEWAVIGSSVVMAVSLKPLPPPPPPPPPVEWAVIGEAISLSVTKGVLVPPPPREWAVIGESVSLPIAITLVVPPPPPPPPPPEKKFPWEVIAVAGGGVLLLAAAAKKKPTA